MSDNDTVNTRGRRSVLRATASAGVLGLLAGCADLGASGAQGAQEDDSGGNIVRNGDRWVTFGDRDQWGMRANKTTGEFEIAWDPFGTGTRKNIRIQPDTNEDKGDVHVDDSLIVENEFESADGSVTDPSYTFSKQNNTGFWRDGGGVIGVATVNAVTAKFDNGTTRLAGDLTTLEDSPTTIWDASSKQTPNLPASNATASGDGSKTTFSLAHALDEAPRSAVVTPTSADAAGSFWVSEKTAEAVEITYTSAPPAGSDNLSFDLVVSL